MIDKTQLSNPKTHYGSGKHATRSFRVQRITAMLLIPLAGFFVWFVVRLAGADRAQMLDLVRNPVIAVLLVVLIGTVVAQRPATAATPSTPSTVDRCSGLTFDACGGPHARRSGARHPAGARLRHWHAGTECRAGGGGRALEGGAGCAGGGLGHGCLS